jgi:hypothetical protein
VYTPCGKYSHQFSIPSTFAIVFLLWAHPNKKTALKNYSAQKIETNTLYVETCFKKVTAKSDRKKNHSLQKK